MVAGRSARGEAGFTLIELLVVVTILFMLAFMMLPSIGRFTHRANLETTARQATSLIQAARREAVRSNTKVNVVFDFGSTATDPAQVYAYDDTNGNNVEDAGEREVGRFALPKAVYFWGAQDGVTIDAVPEGANALLTFGTGNTCTPACPNGGFATFLPDSSAVRTGAVHFGDDVKVGTDGKNVLEVKVAVAATAKLELRKWDANSKKFLLRDENGVAWTWY
jgi:prepilin-type N-terminal cleavage/methylation domain-containing protein